MLQKDIRGFPSITSLAHSIFLYPSKKLPPAIIFSFFKEKDTFFVREWLRQEGLENSARYSCIVR